MRARLVAGLLVVAALTAGCRAGTDKATLAAGAAPASAGATTTTAAVPTTAAAKTQPATSAAPATTAKPAAAGTTAAPTTAAPAPTPATRKVFQQAWTPYATVGGVTLRHPSDRVEIIGYHQSNLDGARPQEPLPTSAPSAILEDRSRDTAPRGAADIVVDPDGEIRAPVSGTVTYAGTYVLYCKYSDDFLIINPDDHPGWEVKMLHISGVIPRPGQRVTAGQTVVAPHATRLPFASQVEDVEAAGAPVWPHVHIEVDDPDIPDRPTGGGC